MASQTSSTNLHISRHGPPSLLAAFNSLPIELNKAIAHFLDTDKDIVTFQLVCRSTNNAVNADNGSFWRARFRQTFAMRGGLSNEELKSLYQHRKKQLRVGEVLKDFCGNRQRECGPLEVLRDLIIESFSDGAEDDEYDRSRCRNLLALKTFVYNSKLLIGDRRTSALPAESKEPGHRRLLAAIRIICSHFLFEPDTPKHHIYAFEQSQYAVYLSTNAAPIYEGADLTSVNFSWVLHCLQFFRYHMTSEAAATLYETVDELSPAARPFAWQGALQNGAYPLGKHWKGTYAYLESHEVRKLRKSSIDEIGETYLCDKNVDEGKIQTLELDFINGNELLPWPRLFESRLHSLRNTGSTRLKTQGRIKPTGTCNIQFTGQGVDLEDDFNTMGWLNPLPAQEGIPGWQRITFMKHFIDDFDQIEQDNLWAYEGVVLPGGRIILGRWWYASEQVDFNNDYNGPFILWAVDEDSEF